MQEILIRKLHQYLEENNPDILLQLETVGGVSRYLREKIHSVDSLLNELSGADHAPYYIEEVCLHELTAEYKPSRFHYIVTILEEAFETTCTQWRRWHILPFEVTNLIRLCQPFWEGFTEDNEESADRKMAVTEVIRVYVQQKSENENSESWDTMYSKN